MVRLTLRLPGIHHAYRAVGIRPAPPPESVAGPAVLRGVRDRLFEANNKISSALHKLAGTPGLWFATDKYYQRIERIFRDVATVREDLEQEAKRKESR